MTGRGYIKLLLACCRPSAEFCAIRQVVVEMLIGRQMKPIRKSAPAVVAILDTNSSALTLLRRRQVELRTGYARSTLYLRVKQGLWPRPVRLGIRAVGWPAGEVAALNGARIAGLSDTQIRSLVTRLLAARLEAICDKPGAEE